MIIKDFGYTPCDIKFNEGNHTYRMDGLPVSGVSSIIGRKDKEWKAQWVLKLSSKYLADNLKPGVEYSKSEIDNLIKEAKTAHTRKSEQALDSGKIAHGLIEESIVTRKRFDPAKLNFGNEQTNWEVRNIYGNWLLWDGQHTVNYLAVELVLADREMWIAGTADCIAIVDGVLTVLDWKSSKQFSEDLFLQLAAYKYMLIKGGVNVEIERRGVRLDKGVDADGRIIEDYVPEYNPSNDIVIPTKYEDDIEAFTALRKVDKWCKRLNKDYSYYKKAGKSGWYVLNINKDFN